MLDGTEPIADAAPLADDAAPAAAAAGEESPDEMLRRLEEEKLDWQRQLNAMKETLEAQDRKMEEDRCRRREFLKREEQEKEQEQEQVKVTQVVAANSHLIGTRRDSGTQSVMAFGTQSFGGPQSFPSFGSQSFAQAGVGGVAVMERTRAIWPGMSNFHNQRARAVAKTMPQLAYESHVQQQYGAGPSRSSRGRLTQYGGQRTSLGYPDQRTSFGYPDQLMRMPNTRAKVYNVADRTRSNSGMSFGTGTFSVGTGTYTPGTPTGMSGGSVSMRGPARQIGTPTSYISASAPDNASLLSTSSGYVDPFCFYGGSVDYAPPVMAATPMVPGTPMMPMYGMGSSTPMAYGGNPMAYRTA